MAESQKLHFKKTPPGTGYHAGMVVNVPEHVAKDMVGGGYAVPATPVLPNDLPGRDAFIAAGYETVEQIKSLEDPTKLTGIGKGTADQLAEYFKEK